MSHQNPAATIRNTTAMGTRGYSGMESERRHIAGFWGSECRKPARCRRSAPSAFRAGCEIFGLTIPGSPARSMLWFAA